MGFRAGITMVTFDSTINLVTLFALVAAIWRAGVVASRLQATVDRAVQDLDRHTQEEDRRHAEFRQQIHDQASLLQGLHGRVMVLEDARREKR